MSLFAFASALPRVGKFRRSTTAWSKFSYKSLSSFGKIPCIPSITRPRERYSFGISLAPEESSGGQFASVSCNSKERELNVMFPSIASWDAVHPLIVHFPIALLLGAPVLVIIGMLLPRHSVGLFIAAFVLMVMGTTAVYLAVASGEAAAEVSARMPPLATVLENHEELAETTRLIFTVLTVIFAAILFGPRLFKRRLGHNSSVVLTVAFLLLYSAGSLVLINAAHQGGKLVHEFGLRAGGTATPTPATTSSETSLETRKKKQLEKNND